MTRLHRSLRRRAQEGVDARGKRAQEGVDARGSGREGAAVRARAPSYRIHGCHGCRTRGRSTRCRPPPPPPPSSGAPTAAPPPAPAATCRPPSSARTAARRARHPPELCGRRLAGADTTWLQQVWICHGYNRCGHAMATT
eukprot:683611-Prorocentrum_minimum.AAC.1